MLHRHRYERRAAGTATLIGGRSQTRILSLCAICGKPRVEHVEGKWSAADLGLADDEFDQQADQRQGDGD